MYLIVVYVINLYVALLISAPGSLRPLRTVRATFTAYGSSTFKANLVREDPAIIFTPANKSSDLFAIQS